MSAPSETPPASSGSSSTSPSTSWLGRWRMEKTTAWLLGTVHFDRNIGFWRKRKLRQAATSDFNQMTLKRPLKLNARPHFQILRPAQPIKLQYFKSDQLHRTARKPRHTTTKYITANDPTREHWSGNARRKVNNARAVPMRTTTNFALYKRFLFFKNVQTFYAV